MQYREDDACNGHETAFEDHERDVIVGQIVLEATTQIRNTKTTPA